MRRKQMMHARRKSNCGGKKFQKFGEKILSLKIFQTLLAFLLAFQCYLCGALLFVCVCTY